jgi:murein DD-endopeptidase MepM/ murein hydrolase activator NlpD
LGQLLGLEPRTLALGAVAAVLIGVILVAGKRPAVTDFGEAGATTPVVMSAPVTSPTVEFVSSIDGQVVTTDNSRGGDSRSSEVATATTDFSSKMSASDSQAQESSESRVLIKTDPQLSLAAWFRRIGVSDSDHLELLEAGPAVRLALEAGPDDEMSVTVSPQGELQSYQLIRKGTVHWSLVRAHSGFTIRTQPTLARVAHRLPTRPRAIDEPAVVSRPATTMTPKSPIASSGPQPGQPIEAVVRKGDSLYAKFREAGLRDAELALLLKSKSNTRALKRIRPGQKLRFFLTDGNRLDRLEVDLTPVKFLRYSQTSKGFRSETVQRDFERRQVARRVVIERSLFEATTKASIPEPVAAQLTEIFGWDIDFLQDLRSGDALSVVYEEHYLEGEYFRAGPVLSAEVVNRGKPIRAVRYVDNSERADYYTPKGRPLKRAFLRTPVRFSRISSRFNLARRHPILHKLRAHRGVDYSAPTGTPIKATGDGRVAFAGRKGGYGKTVVIRHGGRYETLYAHMSRYARGMKRGRRVRQGDVIGYVGRTGLATGPHLHYEFRVAGKFRDPLKVKLPRAERLTGKEWKRFQKETRDMLARLESISATQFALARS